MPTEVLVVETAKPGDQCDEPDCLRWPMERSSRRAQAPGSCTRWLPRTINRRAVVNAIVYLLRTSWQSRLLPYQYQGTPVVPDKDQPIRGAQPEPHGRRPHLDEKLLAEAFQLRQY